MAYESIGDLLNRASDFEERLVKYYAALRDESNDNGVRLLTYYLSRHRRHLQNALDDLSPTNIENIRKVKIKYDVDFYPENAFHVLDVPPSKLKGKDILEAAIGYDEELVKLYKTMLENPLSTEASVFIETLIRVEEREIVMLKKMIAMDYF